MKTRVILLIALSAIITLSFTFVSVNKKDKAVATTEAKSTAKSDSEPIGGFLSEDKL